MNLYFLVEGKTEAKVYPAWLSHLLPTLTRVDNYDDVERNNYFLISAAGYPCIIYDGLPTAIEEIRDNGKYNYLVLCLDADEDTISDRQDEIHECIREKKLELGNTALVIMVQNRCIETWFLGNRKVFLRNPQTQPLLDYTRYYDVADKDPENMGKYKGFATHAKFHEAYLKAIFGARRISYTKRNPGDVLKKEYLEQLQKRIRYKPKQLLTLGHFLKLCDKIKYLTADNCEALRKQPPLAGADE